MFTQTIFDQGVSAAFRQRLANLKSDTPARWGRFTAPQMLAHVNDQLRMTLGELPTKPKNLPIRFTPIKQFIIYLMPFPRGAPTAPELLRRIDVTEFEGEREAFAQLIERVAARANATDWPEHPAFGQISCRAWGVLGYRHTDHHFTQFGV